MSSRQSLLSLAVLTTLASGCAQEAPSRTGALVCTEDFGGTGEARRLRAFLRAAADLEGAALDVEADLGGACTDMGVALGMTDAELEAGVGGREGAEAARVVCDNVRARIDVELDAIHAEAEVTVVLEVEPPHCDVSIDAYASCVAECEAEVDPGAIDVTCERGEIRGSCDAVCTGSCAVTVAAVCEGRCEGACDGSCSAEADDGSCAGTCDGTCRGRCVVESDASCAGECRGTCSVEMREPRCTGEVRAPSATVACQADCDATIAAQASCDRGRMTLRIDGDLSGDLAARAERLVTAFAAGGAAMLELRARATILRRSATTLVDAAAEVPRDVLFLGAGAGRCATEAAAQAIDAAASIGVSFSVSVEVSATLSASAG